VIIVHSVQQCLCLDVSELKRMLDISWSCSWD